MILQFLQQHGYALLFAVVFAEQVGLPIPALPVLVGAGAFAAAGTMSFPVALAVTLAGSMTADLIWFYVGWRSGHRVLGLLCRIALEPDSCIRRTENGFIRYGVRSLLVAKFVPAWSTAAPPLAGVLRVPARRFVVYNGLGALLWGGTWAGLGFAFGGAIVELEAAAERQGARAVAVLATALGLYFVVRYVSRRRFLRRLRTARITVDDLKVMLDRNESVVIVDLRAALDIGADPYLIPGAFYVAAEQLHDRELPMSRDTEIVVYCT